MGGESPYAPARTDHQHPIALLHTSAIHLLGGRETRTRDRRGDPRRKVVRDNGAHVGVHRGPSSQTSLTGQIMVDGHARADHDLRGVAYRLDPSHDIQAQDVRPRPPVGTRLSQFPVHRVQPTGLDGQPHLTRTRGRDVDGRRTHLPWRPGRHQGDALGGQDVVIGLIHSGEIAHASAPEPGVHLGIVGFPSVLQVNVDLAAQPVVARSAAFRPIRGPETASATTVGHPSGRPSAGHQLAVYLRGTPPRGRITPCPPSGPKSPPLLARSSESSPGRSPE